jgi:hypothetical protein
MVDGGWDMERKKVNLKGSRRGEVERPRHLGVWVVVGLGPWGPSPEH